MMTNRLQCSIILFFTAAVAQSQPTYVIQSGHTGPVNIIRYQDAAKRLITAGADGLVKVWDIEKHDAVYSQPIAPRDIYLLSVHPDRPLYAAVFAEESQYTIVVRDWSNNEEPLRVSFPVKPLMVEFSPRGTYLAVCLENWRSLYVYTVDDGKALPVFQSGFGIVSYVAFSTKESTLMTYQPSGRISYWETATGKKLSELKTQAGLLPVCLSANKVHLICSRKNEITFLDVVSGKTSSRVDIPGLVLFSGDGSGERLAFFSSRRGERESVSLAAIVNGGLQEIFKNSLTDSNAISSLLAADQALFAGNNKGEVFLITRNKYEKIIENNLLVVSDMAVRGTMVTLGALRHLFVFKSDFFLNGRQDSDENMEMSFRSVVHPYTGMPIGMAFDGDRSLALWQKNGAAGGVSLLDRQSLALQKQYAPFASPPLACTINDGLLLAVEEDGTCVLADALDGTTRFRQRSAGINTAVFMPPSFIVCGKSRLSSYESSLALIKTDTGEITFLPETADIIYDLVFDRVSGTLYSVGLERKNNLLFTVVKQRTGKELKNEKKIFSKPGRFFGSVLSFNAETRTLYFSLEENVVYFWDGTKVEALESSPRPVRRLYSFPGIIYALNSDSSVTAWDPTDGRIVFNLYLFNTMSWLLVTSDGYHVSQGDIMPFVRVYEDGAPLGAVPDDYRLNLSVTKNAKDSL